MNFISLMAGMPAGSAGAAAGGQQNPMSMVIMMAALFGVMYFVMIRPQKKKQK